MHSRKIRRVSFFALAVLLIIACSPALFVSTAENSAKVGISLEKLQLGRKLYLSHCGSCHSLYLPKQFDADRWTRSLNKMQGRAKITDAEKSTILKYITSQ